MARPVSGNGRPSGFRGFRAPLVHLKYPLMSMTTSTVPLAWLSWIDSVPSIREQIALPGLFTPAGNVRAQVFGAAPAVVPGQTVRLPVVVGRATVTFAVTAVASGAFPYSTGEVINVDGGYHLRVL